MLRFFILTLLFFTNFGCCQNDTDDDQSDKSKRQSQNLFGVVPSLEASAKNRNELSKILPDILSKQSSLENADWKVSLNSLSALLDTSYFNATICGHRVLPYRGNRAATFSGFLDFERRRYKKIDTKPETVLTEAADGNRQIIVTLTLKSVMGFNSIEKFDIRLGPNFLTTKDLNDWNIRSIDFNGACLNSQNFDKKYVIDTWQTKQEPGDETAEKFVELVSDLIPFTDKSDQKHFDKKFVGFIDTASNTNQKYNSNEFKAYMIRLMKRYKHRKDLKVLPISSESKDVAEEENEDTKAVTNIITQQKDHVVFRTSTIFQSIKDEYLYELWDFQIEAVLNSESQWKIVRIFLRPPMYYIGNSIMETEFLTNFVRGNRKTAENNMTIGKFPHLHVYSGAKNITFCNKVVENVKSDSLTKRFSKFHESTNATLSHCRDEIITTFPNISFNVECFFNTNNGEQVVKINYGATFESKKDKFNVNQIEVVCPSLMG